MRSVFAFALVAVSALAGGSALASTYSYQASYSGTLDHTMDAGCFFDCGRITIFGSPVEDLRGMDYRVEKTYVASNVQTSTHGDLSEASWDETIRLAVTINGVTVTAFGTGSASWSYDSGLFYNNLDQWSYRSSFSGSSDGLDVSMTIGGLNYPYPGLVPVDGPLFSAFDVTTEGAGARLQFGDLDLVSGDPVHAEFREISPVPVPASLPLMITALIGLFLLARRRIASRCRMSGLCWQTTAQI